MNKPDLLISNVMVPEMTGIELAIPDLFGESSLSVALCVSD